MGLRAEGRHAPKVMRPRTASQSAAAMV